MRVSNDERSEVADCLSKHYSDGRLDEEEFNERLDRAMKAKTRSDLTGLFRDLPNAAPPSVVARQRQHHPFQRLLFFACVVLITALVGQALARSFFPVVAINLGGAFIPLLLIGFAVFLWMRHTRRHDDHP